MPNRPTAIIADKSEAVLMYLSILLNRMDFEALPVSSGANLLKMAEAVQPNLIILGQTLLDMDGAEALQALRAQPRLAETPVIVAADDAAQAQTYQAAGCQSVLAKPIEVEELHAALEVCRVYPNGQRKFLRAPYERRVKLTWNFQTIECQAVTLSAGGIYIRKRVPFPQGCLVDVSIPLDNDQTLELEGEVIYSKPLAEDRFTMPPGMAVCFFMVSTGHADRLKEYITRLLVSDLIAEQDEPVLRN